MTDAWERDHGSGRRISQVPLSDDGERIKWDGFHIVGGVEDKEDGVTRALTPEQEVVLARRLFVERLSLRKAVEGLGVTFQVAKTMREKLEPYRYVMRDMQRPSPQRYGRPCKYDWLHDQLAVDAFDTWIDVPDGETALHFRNRVRSILSGSRRNHAYLYHWNTVIDGAMLHVWRGEPWS